MNDISALVPLSRWLVDQPAGIVATECGVAVTAQDFTLRVQAWVGKLDEQPGARWAVFIAIVANSWQSFRPYGNWAEAPVFVVITEPEQ